MEEITPSRSRELLYKLLGCGDEAAYRPDIPWEMWDIAKPKLDSGFVGKQVILSGTTSVYKKLFLDDLWHTPHFVHKEKPKGPGLFIPATNWKGERFEGIVSATKKQRMSHSYPPSREDLNKVLNSFKNRGVMEAEAATSRVRIPDSAGLQITSPSRELRITMDHLLKAHKKGYYNEMISKQELITLHAKYKNKKFVARLRGA